MSGKRKMGEDLEILTAVQEERLEFVELLAYFHGTVSRDEIMNRFSISAASATNILSQYSRMAPENLSYNIRLKWYEIGKSFKPVFNVRKFTERIPMYTMPGLYKPVDKEEIERIARISRAIQRTQSLTITYSSASGGRSPQQIVPVAFADNGLCWHVRAYGRNQEQYADFVFRRILDVCANEGDTVQDHEHPENDKQWHSFIDLTVKAHPHNLEDAQYFTVGTDTHTVRIRAAMAGYFLQFWNVDCSSDAKLRGEKYKYVLANVTEIAKVADLELAPGYEYKGNLY